VSFNEKQVAQLLKPIRKERVLQDGKGHAHVSQQDITAHLIRVFGFGNFDIEAAARRCRMTFDLSPRSCPSCHGDGHPRTVNEGRRLVIDWTHLPYCRIGRTTASAAQPLDVSDYLDGDYRGTAFPYERGDAA
jgi:hypothetical protein